MQRALPKHARNSRWKAEVHTHDAGALDLSAAVVSASTRKSLAEPAGSFTMTLKPSARPGGDGVDLLSQIRDDDWMLVGATDADGVDWITTTGLVDSVRRQRVGTAGATTYTVAGRDLGKVLLKTDMLDVPWLAASRELGMRNAATAFNIINGIADRTPGRIVAELLSYMLQGGQYRGPTQMWAVPESMRFRPEPGLPPIDPIIRQASDVILTSHIDTRTPGLLPTNVPISAGLGSGGALWTILTQYANPVLNELVLDQLPPPGDLHAPTAYAMDQDGFALAKPALRLRQKPFPALTTVEFDDSGDVFGGAFSQSDNWRMLPANEFPESDLEVYDVGRSGAERFNWFSLDPAESEITSRGITAMLFGKVKPEDYWDAVPAILRQSAERHGFLRFQQTTPYINSTAEQRAGTSEADAARLELITAAQWVKLLRDWYAPNPVFLSGSATVAYLCPGVRVGERLRIHLRSGEVEEFYIEAVEHRFVKRPDGSAHGSTTLSVTRGWRLPDARADYATAVERWLADNLEVMV